MVLQKLVLEQNPSHCHQHTSVLGILLRGHCCDALPPFGQGAAVQQQGEQKILQALVRQLCSGAGHAFEDLSHFQGGGVSM